MFDMAGIPVSRRVGVLAQGGVRLHDASFEWFSSGHLLSDCLRERDDDVEDSESGGPSGDDEDGSCGYTPSEDADNRQ
jgi:hypothetical protein